jgi:phospholipid/cholesterol/gamma-HCH transport system substrate-binding protein
METDRHYFIEGLFVIGFCIAAAVFSLWLVGTGHRDDVLYRIHFSDSVSGLALGDAVKFHGVDVGTVKAITLDPTDPRLVQVDVRLRKDTPIKTDTKAILRPKGVTGVVVIELDGGNPDAPTLLASTREGQIPEIASEKSSINLALDSLPKLLERFASIEGQVKKVLTDVNDATSEIKQNPSVLLWGKKDKPAPADAKAGSHR